MRSKSKGLTSTGCRVVSRNDRLEAPTTSPVTNIMREASVGRSRCSAWNSAGPSITGIRRSQMTASKSSRIASSSASLPLLAVATVKSRSLPNATMLARSAGSSSTNSRRMPSSGERSPKSTGSSSVPRIIGDPLPRSTMRNVVPSADVFATEIVPPCAVMMP
jgi:hypothetical protein